MIYFTFYFVLSSRSGTTPFVRKAQLKSRWTRFKDTFQQPYVVSSSSNGQHGCHSKAWLGVTEWPLVCSDVIQLKEEAWQTYWEWEQDVQWRDLDAKETQEMRLNPEQGTDQNRGSRNPAELEFATDMSLWK